VTRAVIVGIGQPAAGDDGVGLLVARAVAARGHETRESADASILLTLFEDERRVVVVDAVVDGGVPGSVLQLDTGALASGPAPLSSHGLGVAEALALAGTLYGAACVARVAIVGVAIAVPAGLGVAEALELARTLYGARVAGNVQIVGIAIDPPTGGMLGLSPAVAAAVEPAAVLAVALADAE
jgi:hydrogenase maturation protease